MRVIITGGTGMIGSALAERLLRSGDEVILLSRNPQAKKEGIPAGARMEAWDGQSAAGWGKLVNSETAIVNLAGENLSAGLWTESRKKRIIDSRVNAGLAVSQSVDQAEHKPAVVIQSSAVGFYGVENPAQLNEKHGPGKDFLSQVCLSWEASTSTVEKLGVRRAIIRTGVVLSKDEGALSKMLLPFYFFVGGPIGSGNQGFSWIHLQDEVAAIEFIIRNSQAKGVFNLTAPKPVSNRQFTQLIGKVLKRPAIIPLPGFILKLILGEMSTVLLDGQYALPERLIKHGYQFSFEDAESALRDLLKK